MGSLNRATRVSTPYPRQALDLSAQALAVPAAFILREDPDRSVQDKPDERTRRKGALWLFDREQIQFVMVRWRGRQRAVGLQGPWQSTGPHASALSTLNKMTHRNPTGSVKMSQILHFKEVSENRL